MIIIRGYHIQFHNSNIIINLVIPKGKIMNKTGNYDVTVIVPVYNEEDNIERIEEKLGRFMTRSSKKVSVLFINDGSADSSMSKIEEVCSDNEDFYYIDLKKNQGLSYAIKAGFDSIESQWTGYIDADLQTDPDDFNLLFNYADNYDLVSGIRADRKDTIVKKLSSRVANNIRRMITGDNFKDTGCPLKVIKTSTAQKLPFFNGMHRFIPALVVMVGGTVKQLPVKHYKRVAGESKYHLFNRLWGPLNDCFAFRWMKAGYISYDIKQTNIE